MKTKGTVIETYGDKARVMTERSSACGNCEGCSSKGSCHTELLLSETGRTYELEVENTLKASVGDVVEVSSSGNLVLVFAVVIFLIPVIASVVGYLISDIYLDGSYPVLVSGASFLLVFLTGTFIINKVISNVSHNIISKIIKESGDNAAQTNAYKK